MIAGTNFTPCLPEEVAKVAHRMSKIDDAASVMRLVSRRLKNEEAIPFICDDGLLVVTLKERADGTIVAMILLGLSFGEAGAFKRQEESIMALARNAGADEVAFNPSRKGWARMLGSEWVFDGEEFIRRL